jgi:hypothetical protein
MPAGANENTPPIWASTSNLYNVEHIFFKLAPGNYEVWVRQTGPSMTQTPYALAWWDQAAPGVGGLGSTRARSSGPG